MADAARAPRGKRRRLLVIGLVVALVGGTFWLGPPIICMFVTDVHYVRRGAYRGPDGTVSRPETVRRSVTAEKYGLNFCFQDPQEEWFVETGLLSERFEPWSGHITRWNSDGTIEEQFLEMWHFDRQTSPPWQWGMTDQTEPSAPWVLEGISFEEWWAEIPEAMKIEH